jgi:maltokinase
VIEEQILSGDLGVVGEEALIDFVESRRWFGSKAQDVAHVRLLDSAVLRTQPPLLLAALAEVRFGTGRHELYQLLLGFRPGEDGWEDDVVSELPGWIAYEALNDPALARELVHMMRGEATVQAGDGTVEFRSVDLGGFGPDLSEPRPVGVEQSNSSVVFGDELILKAYRRIEPGINPELELLRFLTEIGFPHIAPLVGWYAYSGRLIDATLGVLQEFLPGSVDGWELALAEIASDAEGFLARLRRLGEVTGELHSALASAAGDPDFSPEEPSSEALALLTATVDEEIEQVFLDLPDDDAVAPIAGRGEEVRERLRLISHVGAVGRVIRTHGDFHLGQVLWTGSDWVVLDFEGEPARPLAERRNKRSPLRDVAGMLRSFAYAASASELANRVRPPEGWEERARNEFLGGYWETVDRTIVPPGEDGRQKLLAVFELEKAVYELRYELNNRPEWVGIPVAGIMRLLESPL